jgi:hypothetical protein
MSENPPADVLRLPVTFGVADADQRTGWQDIVAGLPLLTVTALTLHALLTREDLDAVVVSGQALELFARRGRPELGETYPLSLSTEPDGRILYANNVRQSWVRVPWLVEPPSYPQVVLDERQASGTSWLHFSDDLRHITRGIATFNAGPWEPKIRRLGWWVPRRGPLADDVRVGLHAVYRALYAQ